MSKKSMCKWDSKEIEEKKDKFLSKIIDAKYYCKKCGRVATKDSNLCKAESFNNKKTE